MRKIIVRTALVVVGLGVVAAPLTTAAAADGDYSLNLRSARFVGADYEKTIGGGSAAKATWTKEAAKTGSYSVLLQKKVATSDAAAAVIDVIGVRGLTVEDLGQLSMDVKGYCNQGSPRFNLAYDSSGDGASDGTAFYGCGNNSTGSDGGWAHVATDTATDDNGTAVSPTWTVVALQVVLDETGASYVDNVGFAGVTLGEPRG